MGSCFSSHKYVLFIDNSRNFNRRPDMYLIRYFNSQGYPIHEYQTRVGCLDQVSIPVENVEKVTIYYLPDYDMEIEVASFMIPLQGTDVMVVPFF